MNKRIFFLMALALAILIAPMAIRLYNSNPLPMGEESFYNMKLAKNILHGSSADWTQEPNLYHYALAGAASILPFEILVKLLPFVLGLLCIILLYTLLARLGVEEHSRYYIAGAFILSPVFVYLHTTLTHYAVVALLNLIALYIFLTKRFMFSSAIMVLISFIDFFAFLGSVFVIFVFAAYSKRLKQLVPVLIITALLILAKMIIMPLGSLNLVIDEASLAATITGFGGFVGYGTFLALLFLIGFVLYWRKQNMALDLAIMAAFIFSLYNPVFRIYMGFVVCVYAGLLLHSLAKRRWSLGLLKKITLILVLCSLVFSVTVYVNTLSFSEPTPELVNAIAALKLSKPGEKVLSIPEYSEFIEYYSPRGAVLDSQSSAELLADAEQIFYSRDLKQTAELLDTHGIRYVLVTREMLRGRVWSKDDEGLLFLMKNSGKFINIYEHESYALYQYIGVMH